MHTIRVRPATVEDAPGIARVLVDSWKAAYAGILPAAFLDAFTYAGHESGTRQLLEHLPATSAMFVSALPDGTIAGVAYAGNASTLADFEAELESLYVLPSAQGQRHGSALLRRVAEWARQNGRHNLFLWVLKDNPYRRFYESAAGELLPDEKREVFGGAAAMLVAYGWRNLDTLIGTLERRAQITSGNSSGP